MVPGFFVYTLPWPSFPLLAKVASRRPRNGHTALFWFIDFAIFLCENPRKRLESEPEMRWER
jgi:hypothetical protein